MDNIVDLGFVEIIFVVCVNLDVLWAMNGLDFIFLWVRCIILIFLKGFFLKLILKFEGGPYGFKKKSKSAKEELKPFFSSSSKSWGPISKISKKLMLCAS